jgi:hypothetical protein
MSAARPSRRVSGARVRGGLGMTRAPDGRPAGRDRPRPALPACGAMASPARGGIVQ